MIQLPKSFHGSIPHQTLTKLGFELASRSATFLLGILIARVLGEAGFGFYAYGVAVGFVVSQVADLGLSVLAARQVATLGRAATPYLAHAFRLKTLLSLPVVALLVIAAAGQPPMVALGVVALGMSILLQTFLEFEASIYRGQRAILREAKMIAASRLLVAGFGAAAILLGGGILALGLSTLLASGLTVLWWTRTLRQEGWLMHLHRASSPGMGLSQLFKEAFPLGASSLLSIAFTRSALVLIHYLKGPMEVAWFSAAQRLVEPTQLLPAALLSGVFPLYVTRSKSAPQAARALGLKSLAVLTGLGAAASILLWLTAPWLAPGLYGTSFQASVPVVRILSLSIGPAFINYALIHFLIAHGRQASVAAFMAAMLLVHLLMSWYWIPRLDISGAALSMLLAEILLLVCCLIAHQRHAPLPDEWARRSTTAALDD